MNNFNSVELEYNGKKYHIVTSKIFNGDTDNIKKIPGSIVFNDNKLKICSKEKEWLTIATVDMLETSKGVIKSDDVFMDENNTLTDVIDAIENSIDEISKISLEDYTKEINEKVLDLENNMKSNKEDTDKKISNISKGLNEINLKDYIERPDFDEEIKRIEEKIKESGTGSAEDVDLSEIERSIELLKEDFDKRMIELKKSVSDGKRMVANSITNKGVATNELDEFEIMSKNIDSIEKEGLSFYTFDSEKLSPKFKYMPTIELMLIKDKNIETLDLILKLGDIKLYSIDKEKLDLEE